MSDFRTYLDEQLEDEELKKRGKILNVNIILLRALWQREKNVV